MISLDVAKYIKFNIKDNIELEEVVKALELAEERVEVEVLDIENFISPKLSRMEDVDKYYKLMKENLWVWRPLVAKVWENEKGKLYEIFDGNHRLAAAIKIGVKEIPIKNFVSLVYETIKIIRK